MSVVAITSIIGLLQPFLVGTSLGGIAAIATPGRIKRILAAVKIITGVTSPAKVAAEIVTAPVKVAAHFARGDHLSNESKQIYADYKKKYPYDRWHD